MQLTEQELRDKADQVFTDDVPGAITAEVWSDFFVDDIIDSLVPTDESGIFYTCLIGNWAYDLSILSSSVNILMLTDLAVTIAPGFTCDNYLVIMYDEDGYLRDESFYYYSSESGTVTLHFYRKPNFGKFFKVIIQAA